MDGRVLYQFACQIDQTTRCHEFSQIVEGALPTDILRLSLLVQFLHVQVIVLLYIAFLF